MPESDLLYTGFFGFEVKAVAEEGTFDGYASTFNNVDWQGDVVMPGAFTETLKKTGGRVPILMAHQSSRIVGFGLTAVEDAKGLKVEGQFTPDSHEGRNAAATVRHAAKVGHKVGLSIGYRVRKDGAEWDDTAGVRKLKAIDLFEYSIAAVPANPRARVGRIKAAGDLTIREFEEFLRDSGYSKDAACAIASRGYAAYERRDAGMDAAAELKRASEAFMAELRGAQFIFELRK